MTTNDNIHDATPVEEPKANWEWLKSRISVSAIESLNQWLDCELTALENEFQGLVTEKSRALALRNELRSSRQ